MHKQEEKELEVLETYGYEPRDILSRRNVAFFFAILTIIVAISIWLSLELFHYFEEHSAAKRLGALQTTEEEVQGIPPAPRIQEKPTVEMVQLLSAEEEILNNYGWVDKNAGIARVPIERAMDLLAQSPPPSREKRENQTRDNRGDMR
ncbi:MAG TPA: hypothetical protein VNK96_01470 [Fimbriimonadales bacterium]|nr:hypothetical protein [Fimbriimonadales bacterium]